MSDYQAIVIGAGPGGYPCAIRLAQLGIKTLCVEKEFLGGVCLNVGCIPSKALINASHQFEDMHKAEKMGIKVSGDITIDWSALQAWKGTVVAKMSGGIKQLFKANGVDHLIGTASLNDAHTIELVTADGTKTITADHIVIATGSSPVQIPGFAYADAPVIDSTGALALAEIPKSMVIIGGGVIGLELGSVYAKFGTKITVIEMMDQLLPGVDKDAVKVLARKLKKQGVTVMLKTSAKGWEATDDGIVVNVENAKGTHAIAADKVFVSVGRRPNSKGLGLEDLGIEMAGSAIKVDKQLKTNVPGVYAIGDVTPGPMLAHKATHDGEICAEVIAGKNVVWDAKTVPAVIFTDPEIAIAGLQEHEAIEKGHNVMVGKVPFAAIGKAVANNNTDGFVKVIADKDTKLMLGVTIIGGHASDIISEAALAIEMSAEVLDIGLTIHPHPTLGESIMESAKAALGEAIHIVNR